MALDKMQESRRLATISRDTKETKIAVCLCLDGGELEAQTVGLHGQDADNGHALQLTSTQQINISTGIGFLDHMLHALAKHAGWSLFVRCKGDLISMPFHNRYPTGMNQKLTQPPSRRSPHHRRHLSRHRRSISEISYFIHFIQPRFEPVWLRLRAARRGSFEGRSRSVRTSILNYPAGTEAREDRRSQLRDGAARAGKFRAEGGYHDAHGLFEGRQRPSQGGERVQGAGVSFEDGVREASWC